MTKIPQLIISAPTSGAGKTTVSRGLMALLIACGLRAQPFKCGPDYIDTKFHAAVCRRPSVNLDTFFCSADEVRRLYSHYAADSEATVVEGMMGLFDGYDCDRGSTAEIALALGLPVVLVVDARSAAYSLAPLIKGFVGFRDGVRIAGVIFNRVGSKRHEAMLRQVCSDVGIDCFGFLPKMKEGQISSRYLGLDFRQNAATDELVRLIDGHTDWRRLLDVATCERPASMALQPAPIDCGGHIVIARNAEAFSFLYQEHIDRLRLCGPVDFFDPEQDQPLPADTTLLYLPGGYPENRAEALVEAVQTRRSIADYARRGGRILAECGGMMYLCQSLLTDDGENEMCGVLPCSVTARTADRHLSLGYRQFCIDGHRYRGHEFHYSQFVPPVPPSAVQVSDAVGRPVATPVIRQGNVLASYTHLHFDTK